MRDTLINPNTANSKKRACTRKSETAAKVKRMNEVMAKYIDDRTALLTYLEANWQGLTTKERRRYFKMKKELGVI